jgi:hypothetical protein
MARLPETDPVPGVDLPEAPAAVERELVRLVADVVLNKRKRKELAGK